MKKKIYFILTCIVLCLLIAIYFQSRYDYIPLLKEDSVLLGLRWWKIDKLTKKITYCIMRSSGVGQYKLDCNFKDNIKDEN